MRIHAQTPRKCVLAFSPLSVSTFKCYNETLLCAPKLHDSLRALLHSVHWLYGLAYGFCDVLSSFVMSVIKCSKTGAKVHGCTFEPQAARMLLCGDPCLNNT